MENLTQAQSARLAKITAAQTELDALNEKREALLEQLRMMRENQRTGGGLTTRLVSGGIGRNRA